MTTSQCPKMRSSHRLRRRVLSRARWVRLGDFDIESDTDLARPVDYRITKHVPHPDYKRTERYNDIALFQLEADVPFSAFVRPICLNVGPPPPDPTPQVVTGWGSISTGSSITTGLLNRLRSPRHTLSPNPIDRPILCDKIHVGSVVIFYIMYTTTVFLSGWSKN